MRTIFCTRWAQNENLCELQFEQFHQPGVHLRLRVACSTTSLPGITRWRAWPEVRTAANTGSAAYGVMISGSSTEHGNPAFQAVAGYDLATGLGSINVANLLNLWGSITRTPTIDRTDGCKRRDAFRDDVHGEGDGYTRTGRHRGRCVKRARWQRCDVTSIGASPNGTVYSLWRHGQHQHESVAAGTQHRWWRRTEATPCWRRARRRPRQLLWLERTKPARQR